MCKWIASILFYFTMGVVFAAPLPASDVFQVETKKIDPNTFLLHWNIKPDYFLYSERIQLLTEQDSIVHLGRLAYPTPMKKTNKQGHSVSIYRNDLSIPVSVLGVNPGETLLELHYQGCADDGFCYPPETKQIKLSIANNLELSEVSIESPAVETTEQTLQNNSTPISEIFLTHNWLSTLIIFFGLGLLLSFTPCILPMVPVLSGIIVGHGQNMTTKKAFFLSLSYVLSMSLTYALIGAVIALLGANLQINMQSPWTISLFSLIFVLLSLSMFGFYEFKLPSSWQSKIAGKRAGGHYLGAALMGCLSTLILSPCVTAPLIGVLTYIAQTQNILLGSITLFFLSLGMGTPLLLIGTSAGKWLPKTGGWMNVIKAFFGIMLLAVAIYLMSRILAPTIIMFCWAILLIFSGIFAGAFNNSNTHQEKFSKALGILLLSYGLIILIGASRGATDPFQPLAQNYTAISAPKQTNKTSTQSLEAIQATIAESPIPIILDFYADWCASCQTMETQVFGNPEVKAALKRFKVIKIDITANDAKAKAIMNYFKVIAPPTFIFFNGKGTELTNLREVGEISKTHFLKILDAVKA